MSVPAPTHATPTLPAITTLTVPRLALATTVTRETDLSASTLLVSELPTSSPRLLSSLRPPRLTSRTTPELSTESRKLLRVTTPTSNTSTNGKLAALTTRTSSPLPNPMISALTRNSSDGRSMIFAPSPTTCRPLPSDSPDLSPVSRTSATTTPKTTNSTRSESTNSSSETTSSSETSERRSMPLSLARNSYI